VIYEAKREAFITDKDDGKNQKLSFSKSAVKINVKMEHSIVDAPYDLNNI
jgi:hypothetical protein